MAEIIVLLQNKLGHNLEEMSLENMTVFLKVSQFCLPSKQHFALVESFSADAQQVTLALEVTYYCIVYFIKVSIIYLYLRIGMFYCGHYI